MSWSMQSNAADRSSSESNTTFPEFSALMVFKKTTVDANSNDVDDLQMIYLRYLILHGWKNILSWMLQYSQSLPCSTASHMSPAVPSVMFTSRSVIYLTLYLALRHTSSFILFPLAHTFHIYLPLPTGQLCVWHMNEHPRLHQYPWFFGGYIKRFTYLVNCQVHVPLKYNQSREPSNSQQHCALQHS